MTNSPAQSTFVSVLAWIMMIFSGFAGFGGLLQSVLVAFMLPIPPLTESEAANTPLIFNVIFANFHWFVWSLTAFWLAAFVFAFALLRRKEWGRVGAIAVLLILGLTTVVTAILQQMLVSGMFQSTTDAPDEVAAFVVAIRIGTAIFGLLFVAVLTWLALRLNSPVIRAEFSQNLL
jgi:hypothetical protein